MAGAESAQGPFNATKNNQTPAHARSVCVGRTSFGRSHKARRGGARILPVREASQAIKIFESNLGNDQPQPTLMDDGEKKNSKGPTMNTDPFKEKKKNPVAYFLLSVSRRLQLSHTTLATSRRYRRTVISG